MSQATTKGGGKVVFVVLAMVVVAGLAVGVWWLIGKMGGEGGAAGAGAAKVGLPARAPGVVYEADMDGSGDEWSLWNVSKTPDGRDYIGPFGSDEVDVNVDRLPAHKFVRVRFELITYTRWNGDNAFFGRDSWDMRVDGGQPLVHTTFSNCGFFSDNNQQSFPDQFPWYPQHKGWTGSSAKQSLGWESPVGGGQSAGCDSTYAFDLTFPHEGSVLTLQFSSDMARHEKKPYGFLSFKVETVDAAAPADEAALGKLWESLGDEDSVVANKAVWSMVAMGDGATAFVRKKLADERGATGALAPGFEWEAAVDYSAKPAKRLEANKTAAPAVLNVASAENWVAESIAYKSSEQRQRARAVHVLEAIGTEAARGELKLLGYTGTPQDFPPDTSGFTRQRPEVN